MYLSQMAAVVVVLGCWKWLKQSCQAMEIDGAALFGDPFVEAGLHQFGVRQLGCQEAAWLSVAQ